MVDIKAFYEDFTDPNVIINYFKTDEQFIEWLELGTIEDLQWALIAFEDCELYEYCAKIKEIIDKKITDFTLS